MQKSHLTTGFITLLCVLLVLISVQVLSYPNLSERGFPNLSVLRFYSFSAFIAIVLTLSVLLKNTVPAPYSIAVLVCSGFLIFTAVRTFRYFAWGGCDSWPHALSGPASLLTSLVINGGFLSFVAVVSYALARLVFLLFNTPRAT